MSNGPPSWTSNFEERGLPSRDRCGHGVGLGRFRMSAFSSGNVELSGDGLSVAGQSRGGCMTKTIWTGVCTALVAFATAAIGQTTSAPQTNASSSERRITVTGCLQQAPSTSADTTTGGAAGATGTTGTTGTTAGTAGAATDAMANAKFILTNASASDSSSAQGTTASGTAAGTTATGTTATGTATGTTTTGTTATGTSGAAQASGATSASAQTYRLIANPTALSPHVGKKLELTGTLEDQSGTAHPDAGGPDGNAPALRVEAGKVIAASCSQ